jgi:hypothetical protein
MQSFEWLTSRRFGLFIVIRPLGDDSAAHFDPRARVAKFRRLSTGILASSSQISHFSPIRKRRVILKPSMVAVNERDVDGDLFDVRGQPSLLAIIAKTRILLVNEASEALASQETHETKR